ncbi:glycine receptor subunit alphaZ1-like [Mizuhopecten yessoensis]|uniref:Gamma-aminobutyric acid receptor subunit beta n=1 Tax=Mizuhopecten yessoensis TaxID=6573 RepID=A0A210PG09_MIZYE|nr:glycine receptor subunit alphaZ1-like [Mizuhopecten yessoensis]OWF35391.1 Glycine receptor subunit alphaZ1 [Mizuhopecten yessoensis]
MMYWVIIVYGVFSQHMLYTRAQTRSEFVGALIVDYDNRIPPNFEKNNYTEVEVSLFINSIDSISEKTMDYTMNMFIQQEWYDPRLQFFGLIDSTYLELDSKLINDVWVPDLYFTNEKKASFHEVTVPNRMMHLYEDGRIIYRLRVSVTAACPMKLHRYPFDSQLCYLYIQSFAYTMNRLRFKWRDSDPVRTNANLELPQFDLDNYETSDCTGYGTDDLAANFTCIQLKLHLTRSLGFYMIQVYVPTILIVLLSWVSFWLSIDAVPARISLGILTVLTITTQRTNSVSSMPPVSYVKALDVWMAMCLLFVFAALLEYPVVYVMERRDVKLLQTKVAVEEEKALNPAKTQHTRNRMERNRAQRIDNISKIMFPLVFSSFLAIYWFAYTL